VAAVPLVCDDAVVEKPGLRYTFVETPIGSILIAGDDKAIVETYFAGAQPKPDWIRDDDGLRKASDQLRSYFAGTLQAFELPLAPRGTEFQRSVWSALLEIPYGQTTTYSAIANKIERPAAVRAVGAANGANPIPIIIPCHRVIGTNGSLTGFGGGIDVKRQLLALEARVAGRTLF
jgi:methylated-DNA-[protein]-cysteine S-methyltransferase